MDVAVVGLMADSQPIDEATRSLDGMTTASKRTEKANYDRARSDKAAGEAASKAAREARRAANVAMFNSRQLSFQLIDIGQALATAPTMGVYALQNLGFQVAQIGQLYMGRGGFNQAIRDSATQVAAFARYLGPLAGVAAVVGGAFFGLTHEINKTSEEAVGMGDVLRATFNLAVDGIQNLLAPAVAAISPYFQAAWDGAMTFTKNAINFIVGAGVGSVKTIVGAWNDLPAALGDIAYSAADRFVVGMKEMAREAILIVGDVVGAMNSALGTNIARPRTSMIKQGGIENPFQGAAAGLIDNATDTLSSSMNFDYAGAAFNAVRDEANAVARAARLAAEETEKIGGAAEKAKDPWKGLRKVTDDTVKRLQEAGNSLGQSFGGIFRGLISNTMTWKDAALSAINSVLSYLNQRSQAFGGAGIFGGGFTQSLIGGFLGISGFATGTANAPGGLAMVGERGPELVHLPKGSKVAPNHDLGRYMSDNGGGTVVLNYSPQITQDNRGADPTALARQQKQLDEVLKNQAKSFEAQMYRVNVRGARA